MSAKFFYLPRIKKVISSHRIEISQLIFLHHIMNDRFQYDRNIDLNPFQTSFAFDIETSVAFHVETSHLICTSNQMTGFYMKCNTRLKWIKRLNNLDTVGIQTKVFCFSFCFSFIISTHFIEKLIEWTTGLKWVKIFLFKKVGII